MEKKWLLAGCIIIALSIILGAFGAHALKEVLNQKQLAVFETGVRYSMYQGLAFLALPFLFNKVNTADKAVFFLMLFGVILFSGSIFCLTLCGLQHAAGMKKGFGPGTPLGGSLMIIGWLLAAFKVMKWNNGKA